MRQCEEMDLRGPKDLRSLVPLEIEESLGSGSGEVA
jgi:hypothetical protein